MPTDDLDGFIDEWEEVNLSNEPPGGDSRKEGDDHLRGVKATVKRSFPNIAGAVTATHEELNRLEGVSLADPIITFPVGTAQVFYQDVAPLGWTILQTVDNTALAFTKGSGNGGIATGGTVSPGGSLFTDLFTSFGEGTKIADKALSVGQIPPHSHREGTIWNATPGTTARRYGEAAGGPETVTQGTGTGTELSIQAYTESVGGGAGHSHSIDLSLKYSACIIAVKDA